MKHYGITPETELIAGNCNHAEQPGYYGQGITEAERTLAAFPDVRGMVVREAQRVFTQTCTNPSVHPGAPTVDDELLAELERWIAGDVIPMVPEDPHAHCAPSVLLDQSQSARSAAWDRMIADLPSSDPPTDHGCRLANYLAKQERRRNWTLTQSRRVNREGEDGGQE